MQQEVKTQRNLVAANDLEETRGDTVYVQKRPAETGVHCSPSHIHCGEQEDKGQGHHNKGLGEIYTEVISAGGSQLRYSQGTGTQWPFHSSVEEISGSVHRPQFTGFIGIRLAGTLPADGYPTTNLCESPVSSAVPTRH